MPFRPIFHLISRPPRQIPRNQFPLIVILEVTLLQDLIFLPGPRVLLQMGVKVIAIAFPKIFALGSWEDGGELIPAQFATIFNCDNDNTSNIKEK